MSDFSKLKFKRFMRTKIRVSMNYTTLLQFQELWIVFHSGLLYYAGAEICHDQQRSISAIILVHIFVWLWIVRSVSLKCGPVWCTEQKNSEHSYVITDQYKWNVLPLTHHFKIECVWHILSARYRSIIICK